jgi:O-antigen/teichoic acid export membrane protein
VLYILVAPFLFKYLLPQYIDGIFYSQILAISFIFAMPTRYVGLLFEAQKMSRQIFYNNLINSILAIVLYVALGIWGGVLGLVIAYVLWSFIGMLVNFATWRISSRA